MTQAMNDDFSDPSKTSEYSNKQKEYSRYIQRIKEFDSIDKEEHLKKVQELLGLSSEKEVKDFFGDGEIIGISVKNEFVSVLTEDCYCQREFNEGVVDMLEFILNPDLDKGQGKGSEIFYNQVQSFKNKGQHKLVTDAAKSEVHNGYYTWARLGYGMRIREGHRNIGIERFKQILNELQKDNELKDVRTVSELMTIKKGRDFWKKNGFAFNAEFDLSDDSQSMFILNKYMEEKKNARK